MKRREIFVFGSNLAGIHGAGAAAFARRNYGAELGVGVGLTGDSYALPTKGLQIEFIPLEQVSGYIRDFISFAENNNEMNFTVTQIGCGLAGFTKEQIAPLFKDAPDNCSFDEAWKEILGEGRNYWGNV